MKTKQLTMCALFIALTAICSQIQIPLPMVPINLALFAIYMAGSLLGPKYGSITIIGYVVLGAVGLPIFVGFNGGFAVLTGPTGGYIIGYIFTSFLVGFITKHIGFSWWKLALSMLLGLAVCYIVGTIWFMYITSNNLAVSLTYCILPFLPGDAIKISLATILTLRLRSAIPELRDIRG